MSTASGILRVETTAGRGPAVPFTTAISTPPVANLFGASPWQTSAVFSGTATLTLPNLTAGNTATGTVKIALVTFPTPIIVAPNQQAIIVVGCWLNTDLGGLLIGLPHLALTFNSGSASGSIFSLQPGRTYSGAQLAATIAAYYISTQINPVTVGLTMQAVLYGNTGS
jgi:hypothetical protein